MNKKPPELPNIEDATLRACLAPLMEAMTAGVDLPAPAAAALPVAKSARRSMNTAGNTAGLNDNPLPAADRPGPAAPGLPKSLTEWRGQADDDFAALRMAELFLAMTDAELVAAAAEFPRQIAGTVARLSGIKQRLAAHYDMVTVVVALLERAQALADPEIA